MDLVSTPGPLYHRGVKIRPLLSLLSGYLSDKRYLGAVVGRVANRIAGGRFVVEGREYQLDANNGPNALHGGLRGFNKVRRKTFVS